jgi:hypothetical protein
MLKHGPLQRETTAKQDTRNGYSILRSVDRKIKGEYNYKCHFLRSPNSQFNRVRTIAFICNVKKWI